jgi:hypothetical protein
MVNCIHRQILHGVIMKLTVRLYAFIALPQHSFKTILAPQVGEKCLNIIPLSWKARKTMVLYSTSNSSASACNMAEVRSMKCCVLGA